MAQAAGRQSIFITGAASGMGRETARLFHQKGWFVGAFDLNLAGLEALQAELGADNCVIQTLDVSNKAQFDAAVATFGTATDGRMDILFNNAGIMAVPYALTADGFESQIGTNHLGHFALTNMLLPVITDRVVTVSSMMHLFGYISLTDLNWKSRPYLAWPAYGQSKLANLLFTSELQRRLSAAGSPVKAHAAHPGYSATNLQGHTGSRWGSRVAGIGNKVMATDADFGARQTLYAVSAELPGDSFIGPRFAMRGPTGPSPRSPLARKQSTARALWTLSEQLTATEFPL